jgi:hypothetical protein
MIPCEACKEQMKKGLHDKPHDKLSCVWSKAFRGAKTGGHEEYAYQCATCGTLIHHMHDKNDIAPFWTKIDKIPEG